MPSTEQYLSEIEQSTGHELLNAVRYTTTPPGPTFLRGFDAHVRLLSPSSASTLQRGDMVEIQGPSGSGKTAMLNFLAMTAILPERMQLDTSGPQEAEEDTVMPGSSRRPSLQVDMGGKDQHVVCIHSGTMSSPLLAIGRSLRAHITRCIDEALAAAAGVPLPPPAPSTGVNGGSPKHAHHTSIEANMERALHNLTVLRIPNASNPYAPLAALLAHIPTLARGLDKEISLVLLDGIGDGYWAGRWHIEREKEEARLGIAPAGRRATNGVRGVDEVDMHDVMRAITHLRKDLGFVMVVTVPGLWKARQTESAADERGDGYTAQSFWDAHLPPPYPRPFAPASKQAHSVGTDHHWPLTHHITLAAPSGHPLVGGNAIGQFRAEVSVLGALTEDGERREIAREEAEWSGLIRSVRGGGHGVRGQVGVMGFKIGPYGLRP